MLKHLRKKGVSKKVSWFVAVIIILSFGIFGSANILNRTTGPQYAGKIFGKTISLEQFEKSWLRARNQNIIRYGDNFDKVSPLLDLDSEAWDRLILLSEALKQRIKILDQEVIDAIENYSFFQQKGKFDAEMYKRIIRYVFRCEPRDFEESVRESLIFAKLYNTQTLSINITNADVEESYKKQNERIQVGYVLLSYDDHKKGLSVDPVEVKNYYDAHKEELRLSSTINIEYVLLEFPKDADKTAKLEIANNVEAIYQDILKDNRWDEVATTHNLTIKESGFFSEETAQKTGLPLEVLQRALSLEQNKISGPIETSGGFYIIQLKEKKDSSIPSFEEAGGKVEDIVLTKKSQEITKQKADEILKKIKEQLSSNPQNKFTDMTAALNLKAAQTETFTRGQYLPTIGFSKEFQETAFSLNENNNLSDVIELAKGYAILSFVARPGIDQEKFAKEKEEFAKRVLLAKKNEAFSNFIGRLRIKANLQDNIVRYKKTQKSEE